MNTLKRRLTLLNLMEQVSQTTGRQFDTAHAYAEPGYTDPPEGCLIAFGDWNPKCGYGVPKEEQRRDPISRLARILEKAGWQIEWEDEWCRCGDCGKAVRTQPDSYGWTSSYRIVNECELICLDCLNPADYLESIEDNPRTACPPDWKPEDYGYQKYNGTFETGFHSGQDADPNKILKAMKAQGLKRVVFRIKSKGQFDLDWEAYHKPDAEAEKGVA